MTKASLKTAIVSVGSNEEVRAVQAERKGQEVGHMVQNYVFQGQNGRKVAKKAPRVPTASSSSGPCDSSAMALLQAHKAFLRGQWKEKWSLSLQESLEEAHMWTSHG